MQYLRQSTASQEMIIGPFVDSTDGDTEATGLTIANTDIEVYKAGATTHVDKNSGGATHSAKGMYSIVLDATDTDTIGSGMLYVHVAGALPVWKEFCVLDEAVYDVLFGTTAPSTLAAGDAMALTSGERTTLGAALGARTVGPATADQVLLSIVAALLAKTSGGGTDTVVLRNIGDTEDLATVTVDEDENRTAVTITWANV